MGPFAGAGTASEAPCRGHGSPMSLRRHLGRRVGKTSAESRPVAVWSPVRRVVVTKPRLLPRRPPSSHVEELKNSLPI